jgi:hypothetical protein
VNGVGLENTRSARNWETNEEKGDHTAMSVTTFAFWRNRLRASGIHLGISLVIAALAALLVFVVWYPYPYREISGGRELFLILVSVDVILGPLITLAIFDRVKPWAVLRRDLTVVGLIQLAALAYGLWTVFVVRPVHLVFEYDRFRVVHAIDVPPELIGKAPVDLRILPVTGPTLLGLRPLRDGQEKLDMTLAALQGLDLGARPELWQSYEQSRADVLKQGKTVAQLRQRFADKASQIDAAAARTRRQTDQLLYLPMVGRKTFWTILLDSSSAEVLGFIPLDSF